MPLTIIAGMITSAQAEDGGVPWPTQSWQPPRWQGFYFGVNAGAVWGTDDVHQSTDSGASTGFNPSFDTRGGEEGFQAGYNALAGSVLVGADADFDYSGAGGGYRLIRTLDGQDEKFEWLSTVRARVGLPLGNFLPFVTAGAAFSDIKDTYVTGTGFFQDKSALSTGWIVGGGVEYAMAENFTFRLDYRYYNFGSYRDTPTGVFNGYHYKQEPTLNTVTAGISYNFW